MREVRFNICSPAYYNYVAPITDYLFYGYTNGTNGYADTTIRYYYSSYFYCSLSDVYATSGRGDAICNIGIIPFKLVFHWSPDFTYYTYNLGFNNMYEYDSLSIYNGHGWSGDWNHLSKNAVRAYENYKEVFVGWQYTLNTTYREGRYYSQIKTLYNPYIFRIANIINTMNTTFRPQYIIDLYIYSLVNAYYQYIPPIEYTSSHYYYTVL